jgi:CPA2 family monovalent cation:H+ antiporter-2
MFAMETEITQIALVLFIAFVSGMVLERFKLPTLIGYIIAGMVIGPSLLGIHAQIDTIRTLAEFSVLLVFLISFELV